MLNQNTLFHSWEELLFMQNESLWTDLAHSRKDPFSLHRSHTINENNLCERKKKKSLDPSHFWQDKTKQKTQIFHSLFRSYIVIFQISLRGWKRIRGPNWIYFLPSVFWRQYWSKRNSDTAGDAMIGTETQNTNKHRLKYSKKKRNRLECKFIFHLLMTCFLFPV